MVYKVTLDGGLLRTPVLLPAIQTLKAWEAEGKIELFESDRSKEVKIASGWPGAPKPVGFSRRVRTTKRAEPGGLSFQRIAAILFPCRDPHRLNMTEVNDVTHLIRHHALGHSFFVTTNVRDFIADGKRERIKAISKIMILTPEEAVALLKESESMGGVKKPGAVSSNGTMHLKRGAC